MHIGILQLQGACFGIHEPGSRVDNVTKPCLKATYERSMYTTQKSTGPLQALRYIFIVRV